MSIDKIENQIVEHLKEDKEIQGKIFDELHTMRENHLFHIEKDLAKISVDIEWLKSCKQKPEESKDDIKTQNDVDWLKRFFWAIILPAIGSLVVGILNLLK